MPHDPIDNTIKALHTLAEQLLNEGLEDQEVAGELSKRGNISIEYATQIVENVHEDYYKKRELRKHLVLGSVITVGGLATNYFSYQYAVSVGSGSFLLVWGVVVTGIVVLVRGWILFRK